jgi:hypothetical protein
MVRTPLNVVVVSAAALFAADISQVAAQTVQRAAYFSVEAGLATEPEQFSVRSPFGFALAAGVGRSLSEHRAIEGRFGVELFGAPTQIISPGGCLGQVPCSLPQPSVVRVFTLAGDLLFSRHLRATGPLVIAGAGLRYITEAPEHSPELRPFAEIGAGVARAFGAARVGIEARYQLAVSGADLPQWTMPIGINVRFF